MPWNASHTPLLLPKEIAGTCPEETGPPVVLSLEKKKRKDREGEVRKMVIQGDPQILKYLIALQAL